MSTCADCTVDKWCRWFCPVHLEHHVVVSMVTHCVANAPSEAGL